MPHDVPVTPAKRTSDSLAPSSARLARTASNVSSASSFRTAPSSTYRGDDGSNDAPPQVGDRVQAAGMEGILRYVGEVHGKPGTWAGVELVGDYVGKGKNDGTVQG
jgi:CAP-Gly domain-containing linker protein 1